MTHLVHEVDQFFVFFFFNDTATTEIYTLSLHDALPISSDPGIEARTGFPSVKSFPEMRATVENLAKLYPTLYTILPYNTELGGYPHEKAVVDWLQLAAPQAKLKDVRGQIAAMRPIKSPGEIAFLKRAIDLSLDAQLEAMKMMRPGLYEY